MGKSVGTGDGSALVNLSGDMMDDLAAGILDGGLLPEPDVVEDPTWPAELQRIAFGLWAFECGEDVGATVRALEDRTGLAVPVGVVRKWREVGSWGKISPIVHQTLSRSSLHATQRMSALVLVRAQRWALNAFDDPTIGASTKARMYEAVMDRFGFPRLIRGELFAGLAERGGELGDMGDDELQEAWQSYSQDLDHATAPRVAEPDDTMTYLLHAESRAEVNRH